MPQLPDVQSLGRRPIPQPEGGVVRYQPTEPGLLAPSIATARAGEVVHNIGGSLYAANQELIRARQSTELADLLADATEKLSVAEIAAARDPDFVTINQRFSQTVDEIGQEFGSQTSDPAVRGAFQRRYRELGLSKRLNVMTKAAGREQNYHVGKLETALDLYVRTAALSSNPSERELIIGQGRIAINDAAAAGWISETEAVDRETKLLERVDEASVLNDMRIDPTETAIRLGVGLDYAPNLPPVRRQEMLNTAMGQAESRRLEEQRAEEKRVRLAADDAITKAYAGIADGTVKRADIDVIRSTAVSAGRGLEWKNLLEDFEKRGGATSDAALTQVREMLYTDPIGARHLAHTYKVQGKFSEDDYQKILGESHTLERQLGPKSKYERSVKYVFDFMAPIPGVSDPLQPTRQANSVRDFEDWYAAERKANRMPTDEQMDKKAEQVIRTWAVADMRNMARKTGIGARDTPEAALEAIREDALRLQRLHDDGLISPEEYKRRMLDLEQQRLAAEKAATSGK